MLISVKKASDILGVHGDTIRKWSNKGILTTIRIGTRGDRRFDEDEVKALMERITPEKNTWRIRKAE